MATVTYELDQDSGWKWQGVWNVSLGVFPTVTTQGAGSAYRVSVAGSIDSVRFEVGDLLVSFVDSPSTLLFAGSWLRVPAGGWDPSRIHDVAGVTSVNTAVVAGQVNVVAAGNEMALFTGATVELGNLATDTLTVRGATVLMPDVLTEGVVPGTDENTEKPVFKDIAGKLSHGFVRTLSDVNNDTKIEVEATLNADIIQFTRLGVLQALFTVDTQGRDELAVSPLTNVSARGGLTVGRRFRVDSTDLGSAPAGAVTVPVATSTATSVYYMNLATASGSPTIAVTPYVGGASTISTFHVSNSALTPKTVTFTNTLGTIQWWGFPSPITVPPTSDVVVTMRQLSPSGTLLYGFVEFTRHVQIRDAANTTSVEVERTGASQQIVFQRAGADVGVFGLTSTEETFAAASRIIATSGYQTDKASSRTPINLGLSPAVATVHTLNLNTAAPIYFLQTAGASANFAIDVIPRTLNGIGTEVEIYILAAGGGGTNCAFRFNGGIAGLTWLNRSGVAITRIRNNRAWRIKYIQTSGTTATIYAMNIQSIN